MRRVMHGDLTAAARACLAAPPGARAALAARLLEEAHAGHRYHRRFRRPHPRLGDGSLMVRARRERLVDEPPLSDPEYAACLVLMLESLARWRAGRVPGRGA